MSKKKNLYAYQQSTQQNHTKCCLSELFEIEGLQKVSQKTNNQKRKPIISLNGNKRKSKSETKLNEYRIYYNTKLFRSYNIQHNKNINRTKTIANNQQKLRKVINYKAKQSIKEKKNIIFFKNNAVNENNQKIINPESVPISFKFIPVVKNNGIYSNSACKQQTKEVKKIISNTNYFRNLENKIMQENSNIDVPHSLSKILPTTHCVLPIEQFQGQKNKKLKKMKDQIRNMNRKFIKQPQSDLQSSEKSKQTDKVGEVLIMDVKNGLQNLYACDKENLQQTIKVTSQFNDQGEINQSQQSINYSFNSTVFQTQHCTPSSSESYVNPLKKLQNRKLQNKMQTLQTLIL